MEPRPTISPSESEARLLAHSTYECPSYCCTMMDSKWLNSSPVESSEIEKTTLISQVAELSSTTLNVYRERHNIILTPCNHPRKEKSFPSWKGIDKLDVTSNLEIRSPQSFFLQQPVISFHSTPHLLRRGHKKSSEAQLAPVCLIHAGPFWKSWKIQIGPALAGKGVVDPRGVVSVDHTGDHEHNEKALRGYEVRSWRLWGESGKKHHKLVNSQRKECLKAAREEKASLAEPAPVTEADEVVNLRWNSPLSKSTRLCSFAWQSISFFWKGTSTLRETRMLGSLLRYAHLKLIAQLPDEDPHGCPPIEVCLATYTCSIAPEKAGKLELFEAEINRLTHDHASTAVVDLRDIVVATAMCMLMGEFEKRLWVKELLLLILSAGNVT